MVLGGLQIDDQVGSTITGRHVEHIQTASIIHEGLLILLPMALGELVGRADLARNILSSATCIELTSSAPHSIAMAVAVHTPLSDVLKSIAAFLRGTGYVHAMRVLELESGVLNCTLDEVRTLLSFGCHVLEPLCLQDAQELRSFILDADYVSAAMKLRVRIAGHAVSQRLPAA